MNAATPATVIPWERKITPKAVAIRLGIDLLNLPRPVQPRVLYDLFGTIYAGVIKPDRSGTKPDSVQFKGEFQAANPETGEAICESSVAFVPVMESALYSVLQNALARDPKSRIAIALRVEIVTAPADKPSMTGYVFNVQRLVPQEKSPADPIEQLKALARQHAPALPAPKKEESRTIDPDAEPTTVSTHAKHTATSKRR